MSISPPLTSDIVDHVLTSLPDFASLLSAILVSKLFHRVFQAHPSSIITSVAVTQIGSEVLPCAHRLARFNRTRFLTSRTTYVERFPPERDFSPTKAPALTQHVRALGVNDEVVRELEMHYSIVCKDRASGSQSMLNPRESLRFRRAFYRWWLFINLIPPCYLRSAGVTNGNGSGQTEDDHDTDGDTWDDADESNDNADGTGVNVQNAYLARADELRKRFLSEFSDGEVVEMLQIHSFMVFVSIWIRNATSEPTMHDYLLVWNGPSAAAKVLRTLRALEKPEAHFTEVLDWDYGYPDPIWPGFSEYLQGKDYDISKVMANIWDPIPGSDVILDSSVGDTEECEECHVADLGPKMWSSSNWHLLPCVIVLEDVLDNLPGALGWNNHEIQPLIVTPWSFAHFVDCHVSPGARDWSEGKVLCKVCVLKIMGRKAFDSLRERKAQHGLQPEDCWYGYRCRTQRKPAHAAKLNHLCEPTRGD